MVNRFYILAVIFIGKNTALHNGSTQECPIHINEYGLLQAFCANRGLPLVPSKIPANIQVLDLSNNVNLRFTPNAFRRYGHTLLHLKLSHISAVPHQRAMKLAPLDLFLTLDKLEIFEFSYSNLTDDEMWRLPANLRKYIVDGNKYTFLDISTCYKLHEVSARNNQLKKLPILFQPPIHLKSYHLRNNPLDDLRVVDLAPLCSLKTLELEIPEGAFLTTTLGACRCQQIVKWINMFNISGVNLICSNLTECDLNLNEYIHLHEMCPVIRELQMTTLTPETDTGLMSILMKKVPGATYLNMIIAITLACIIIFIIYKFTRPFRSSYGSKGGRKSSRIKKKKRKPNESDDEDEDDDIGHRF